MPPALRPLTLHLESTAGAILLSYGVLFCLVTLDMALPVPMVAQAMMAAVMVVWGLQWVQCHLARSKPRSVVRLWVNASRQWFVQYQDLTVGAVSLQQHIRLGRACVYLRFSGARDQSLPVIVTGAATSAEALRRLCFILHCIV